MREDSLTDMRIWKTTLDSITKQNFTLCKTSYKHKLHMAKWKFRDGSERNENANICKSVTTLNVVDFNIIFITLQS